MDTKSIFQSKVLWSFLVSALCAWAGKHKWLVTADEQGAILDWVYSGVGLVATVFGIYTRMKMTPANTSALSLDGGPVSAAKVVVLGLFIGTFCGGCSASTAPAALAAQTGASIQAYQTDMSAMVEAIIAGYRADEQARVDDLYNAAVASHTDAAGKGDVAAIQGLQTIRLQKYAAIEAVCTAMRAKFQSANVNAANALVGASGLQQYFANAASNAQTMQQAETGAIQLLQAYLGQKNTPTTNAISQALGTLGSTVVVPATAANK